MKKKIAGEDIAVEKVTAKIKKEEKPNKLYYGDNLEVLRKYIKDETVDLCYIDPPFNSKRNYNQIYNNIGKEDKAQAHAFTDTWEWDAAAEKGFDEIIKNEQNRFTVQTVLLIQGLEKIIQGSLLSYLIHITLRTTEIQRVLKPTGTFYLHCDPTASHYLKLVLDSIFCAKGGDFRNEIIWCYRGAGYPKKDFGKRHDIIFRYTKSDEFIFNLDAVREPYAKATIERFSHKIGNKRKGLDFGQQELHPLGKQPDDWLEIQPIAPSAHERLGYPTQKPEKLLERIIKASSNEGDVVLDAYCGCGTTVAVAEKLGRNWVGIDITYQSISLILKRLEDSFTKEKNVIDNIELNGVPQDWESAKALAEKDDDKTRKEFEKWAILFYSKNRARINEKKG
ncbi:MAG TPA: site-specific DNA-methyltransferase, partial [Bacteroidia bacterium]